MKRFLLLSLLLLVASATAFSQASVPFAWDHDGVGTDGYELILSQTSIPNDVDLSDPALRIEDVVGYVTTYTVADIPVGTWYVRVLAYANGVPVTLRARTGMSNEVSITVPTVPPGGAPNLNIPTTGDMAYVAFPFPDNRKVTVTVELGAVEALQAEPLAEFQARMPDLMALLR